MTNGNLMHADDAITKDDLIELIKYLKNSSTFLEGTFAISEQELMTWLDHDRWMGTCLNWLQSRVDSWV